MIKGASVGSVSVMHLINNGDVGLTNSKVLYYDFELATMKRVLEAHGYKPVGLIVDDVITEVWR